MPKRPSTEVQRFRTRSLFYFHAMSEIFLTLLQTAGRGDRLIFSENKERTASASLVAS
jgi:hypothetical protein